jgi:hypothetical protein
MDYAPRRMSKAKLALVAATVMLPFMPLLPYARSGVASDDRAAAMPAAGEKAPAFTPRTERDS